MSATRKWPLIRNEVRQIWRSALAALQHSRKLQASARPNYYGRIESSKNIITRDGPVRKITQIARYQDQPTIYALSTAPGIAAVAIIRISGPACLDIYRALCPGKPDPKPRHATIRRLHAPTQTVGLKTVLDSGALVLYFPAPRTVTGEDVLELHVHGGTAVVRAVLSAIPKCLASHGSSVTGRIRYAEPGEFTRRGFLNGRLDLTQAEALGDLLAATTERQRQLSVRGATSRLSKQYERWRQLLLDARGELEALIDFSEDQHFDESPTELCDSVAHQVARLLAALRAHAQNAVRGELLRNGIVISLLGAPNAGKSSLLNRIVGREAAIVSNEAGTTRDVVEVGLDIGGYFCRLGDTAGLRKSAIESGGTQRVKQCVGQVEEEGMRRARARAAESDVVIVVLSFEVRDGEAYLHLDPEVITAAASLTKESNSHKLIIAVNKVDLCPDPDAQAAAINQIRHAIPNLSATRIHFISCKEVDKPAQMPKGTQPRLDRGGWPYAGNNRDPASRSQPPFHAMQAFLDSLVAHFAELTTAVTGPSAADSIENHSTATADGSIWEESLGASERHRLLLERCVDHLNEFLIETGSGSSSSSGTANDGDGDGDGDVAVNIDDVIVENSCNNNCNRDATKLNNKQDASSIEPDIVLAAEHLRSAATCLAQITGKGESGDVEEVLGVVFEKFCVGK